MLQRYITSIVFPLLMVLCAGTSSCGESGKPSENEVKVAYIYNFAKFVEWPKGPPQNVSEFIHVCVIGDDPFGTYMNVIEGKTAVNRKILVRRNLSLQNIRECEMLFVSKSEQDRLTQILKAVNGLPVLTIGDTEGFAEKGVMINFFMVTRTVRFEINPKAAVRAGLRISSNLLKIARIAGEP